MGKADAESLGIADGDAVRVTSAQGELMTTAKVGNTLPRGLVFMPVSYPDNPVYALFGTVFDPQAKAPALKTCAVRLERTAGNG
jgi:predicted molibdopterin-dependent oxidoreductase YjgC